MTAVRNGAGKFISKLSLSKVATVVLVVLTFRG